ncbi:DUF1849 family protein [Rhodovarius crocodyli]|uniref:DUF1849 family protein n=1 Tax=Rhodovarius crocodyli TaxID=1979269 RepID=A0A437MNK7_9PROT|nr:DUF1849 family protein [Rhodovarius crocodyli]RVT99212.1 DUF1849 family protein [Rhodovarius crocodyli]
MRRILLAGIAAVSLAWALPATAAEPQEGAGAMLAHRAAYRLNLDRVRDQGGVQRAEGAMVFEIQDACEGWTTRQRFTLVVTDRDGNRIETSSDYSTFEAKDGSRLRFSLTQMTEGAVTQRISGEATRNPDGTGRVTYQDPAPNETQLPRGTLFPMMHTIRALATARAGQRILAAPLMDGTDEDGAQETSTFMIGAMQEPQANPRFPAMAGQAAQRMRISFFEPGSQAGAGTPNYEVALRYYANGVADDVHMDFGEFSVAGELLELAPTPGGC